MYTEFLRERDSLNTTGVPPQSINNTTATTGALDMSLFNRAEFVVYTGTGSTSTITAYLQQSDYANAYSPTNISGLTTAAITNLANQIATVEVSATQMTSRYLVGVIAETQVIGKLVTGVLIGTDARYDPANTYDCTAVSQRIAITNTN